MALFQEKVVLITGAASGIGAGTAIEFAKKGASLALVDKTKDKLKEVTDQCVAEGLPKEKILLLAGDLTKEDDISSVFQDTMKHYGTLDTLVNNVGYARLAPIEEIKLSDIDEMYQIHARTAFQLSQLAIPYLKKSQGSIVNVSSVTAQRVYGNHLAYAMAKAANDQLTLYLASELAKHNVRVNTVVPGVTKTNILMNSGLISKVEESDQLYEDFTKTIPLGRCNETSDVAKAIAFLASNDARCITGTKLLVDGGDQVKELGRV